MANVNAMPKPAIAGEANTNSVLAGLSERLTHKRSVIETAKHSLGEAIALEGDATAANGALANAQAAAINTIAKGMVEGLLSKEEATALYGDAYGYAPKKDGTPGKTPNKTGNTLRKRSVLLAEACAIAFGAAPESLPKWAEGKSIETEIAPTVTQWLEGNISPWEAYKTLSEREKIPTPDVPFNEKKLLEIVEAFKDIEKLTRIVNSPALVAAYDAIAEIWTAKEGDIAF